MAKKKKKKRGGKKSDFSISGKHTVMRKNTGSHNFASCKF